jgi:hypothetical protein
LTGESLTRWFITIALVFRPGPISDAHVNVIKVIVVVKRIVIRFILVARNHVVSVLFVLVVIFFFLFFHVLLVLVFFLSVDLHVEPTRPIEHRGFPAAWERHGAYARVSVHARGYIHVLFHLSGTVQFVQTRKQDAIDEPDGLARAGAEHERVSGARDVAAVVH